MKIEKSQNIVRLKILGLGLFVFFRGGGYQEEYLVFLIQM